MTREEASTLLEELKGIGSDYEAINDALDMAIKALSAPPNDNWQGYSSRLWKAAYERGKVDAEQRWIPVSERLPEEYKRVIVSDVFGIYIGEFIDAEENWGGKNFINEHGMRSKSAKAWMPLPEPYRESEDKE